MKKVVLTLSLLIVAGSAIGQGYVFFLHNMFLEVSDTNAVHPEYGKVEYRQIIRAFEQEGLKVISEKRPRNTDVSVYARKVVGQIDSLLHKGVKPSDITVVGTSKGGYIAQYVSGYMKNDQVNFVFIGSCSQNDKEGLPGINYFGNVLSIYERSDGIGHSCKGIQSNKGSSIKRFKEVELNTGLKHGFLFKADKKWLQPTIRWAKQQYE